MDLVRHRKQISVLQGGGEGNNLFYLSGIPHHKVANKEIIEKVVELVESKAKEKVN